MNVYAQASAIIRERGWHQSANGMTARGPNGEVCVYQAIYEASGNDGTVLVAAHGELNRALGVSTSVWQDRLERSEEDVHLLLKYAAADELDTYRILYGPDAS